MWYSASLFFESVYDPPNEDEALWEEQILLIAGATQAEAEAEAERLGRARELEYPSASGVRVRCVLRATRCCCIEDASLSSGTELFSRFLRASEAKSMLAPLGFVDGGEE